MTAGDGSDRLALLTKRADVLRRLCESPAHKRDLVADLDHSRSTLDRAVRALEEADLVERRDDGISATVAGRLAVERLTSFQAALEDAVEAEAVLAPLPPDVPLSMEALAGAEAVPASEPVAYRPLERLHDDIAAADRYRAVLPQLDAPRHVRLLYEHVVTDGNRAEVVVSPELLASLREEFPRQLAAMAEQEGFRLLVAEDPPAFALCLLGSGEAASVAAVVFTDGGGVHGILHNEASGAVRWGEDLYARVRDGATDRTDGLRADADGGVAVVDGSADALGRSLPVALEREGFVRIDGDYFREEPVADPVTAWRAGLSLAEVNTGYAVERIDDGESTDADSSGMAATLAADLAEGVDCVLLGPPGSGKSTLCKRVACEWYAADRGPVLYREQGRGRSLSSVEALVDRVAAADGHALVVVEDAARPEANAVFEAIERLSARPDVSFLLDSRESEWVDPPEGVATPDVGIRYVPSLDEGDCERIVAHFERTLGRTVEVPVERLWEEVREEVRAEDRAASGVLLLLHRLASYADPLAEERTTLEAETASLAASLADEGTALRVCVLANALNAAGIGVDRDALFAVTDPGEYDAVEAALGRLEGEVLFPTGGGYRTVHESWSVTFLAQLPSVLGEEAAAERFGGVVSAFLGLADDRERREAIVSHLDRTPTVAAVEADPAAWANRTVEQFGELARKRPKLAPLYGEADAVSLPRCCPEETAWRWPAWIGEAFLDGGYYDRAERAFQRLAGSQRGDAERALGLAKVANARGDYETAVDHAETVLADPEVEGETAGDRTRRARARLELGRAAVRLGDYDRADEQFRRAAARFEAAGDRRLLATARNFLGRVAIKRGEFDRAREWFEQGRALARECGDRQTEAEALHNLGEITGRGGDLDRAREYHEESVAIRRELGDREGVSDGLGNLGIIASVRGNYDRAREYYERSLAIDREIGNRQGQAQTLNNLGTVALKEGKYDRARERFEASLAIKRDLGDRSGQAGTLDNLGEIATDLGEYDRARGHLEDSLELACELGNRKLQVGALIKLGNLALREGEHDRARDHLETGLERAAEIGDNMDRADILYHLGELERTRGAVATARTYYERAADAFEEGGDRLVGIKITLGRGRLALRAGDLERARERAREARERFEETGAGQWTARSRRLLGRTAAAAGDQEAAVEHLTAALETFEALGATVDELETLLALVDAAGEAGDDAGEWLDRLETVASEAPDAVVERHRDRLDALVDTAGE